MPCKPIALSFLTASLFCVWSPAARADISFLDSFRNVSSQQTGNGNTLSLIGAFFSADLNSTGALDYTSASFTYPGPGSPQTLNMVSPKVFHFQTGFLPDQATMDAQYPFGTYSFSAMNGMTTDMASYDYLADDYPLSHPYLTGTDFSMLQGMDSTKSFTFHLSPFDTGVSANQSFIFLTIFDHTKNMFVFIDNFLASSTTSVVLPANTLTPSDSFTYELIYDNRDSVPSPGAVFDAQLGFDLRTDGNFSAAPVPEPRLAGLLAVGLLGLVILRRRRLTA